MALTAVALSGTTCYCGALNRVVRLCFGLTVEQNSSFFLS